MGGAREAALTALERCRRGGSWPDAVLDGIIKRDGLDRRDAALATRLCYGVLQNAILCDFCIDSYSNIKTKKLEPKVLDIMRLSVYQILFMDKIPPEVSVNEGVSLSKKLGYSRSSGMVNAILRRVSDNRDALMSVPGKQGEEYLSIRYSHPLWLVGELAAAFGYDGTQRFLEACNSETPITCQVNTLRASAAALAEKLGARPHPWLENALLLDNMSALKDSGALEEGLVYIQDAAAKLAVMAAGPREGMKILDGCAAPGGKSFSAAILAGGKAEITACDLHEKKLGRIISGAKRLGISGIKTVVMDAREPDNGFIDRFDLVIADVPCSGLGVIRKKPDIRYRPQTELSGLPEIQGAILDGLSRCVKPGGTLLYATCTIRKRENEDVVRAFLSRSDTFFAEGFELPEPAGKAGGGMMTLLPHIHGTDGFFICRLRRRQ